MSRYIHSGSFGPPVERSYADGRNLLDAAIRKVHRGGPQRPGSLFKAASTDASINAAMAKKLSRQERLRRSNAAEALEEVRKGHKAGGRRCLDEAQGGEPVRYKSIEAIKKARERVVHVDDHRMLSARELNKAFATDIGKREIGATLDVHGYASGFYPMTKAERSTMRKGLTSPTFPRQSDNVIGGGRIAATGASNSWRDQPTPGDRPTIVGSQNTATPSALTRDAAIDAIKMALRKPQKMWGRADEDEDQDQTADLDEDELDDENEDDDKAKNPNRHDAFE